MPSNHSCRLCGQDLHDLVVDLGLSPLCQTVIPPDQAHLPEPFYPLEVWVCHACWLVQVGQFAPPDEIFQRDYPYFSSFSDSWVDHARTYVEQMVDRLGLDENSRVVEVGSNDGYLLQHVVRAGIPCLGVDPAPSVVESARARGVETRTAFFGRAVADQLVDEGWQADLVCGANVMAQVPDLRDFVDGLARLVAPTGTVTIEFPHVVSLFEHREFDTIYHEHFSYFSFLTTVDLFARHGLTVTDVEHLATHGGSIRVHARPAAGNPPVAPSVEALLEHERALGVDSAAYYANFGQEVRTVRRNLLDFLFEQQAEGRLVVGYGAPGKGNTLLNHCGIRPDLLAFTVDRNPAKQGHLLPGSRIPIHAPEAIDEARPDVILILPWNLRDEISQQLAHTREWGAKLVVPIPELEVLA